MEQENFTTNTDKTESQIRKGVLELCVLLVLSADNLYAADILLKLKNSGINVVEGTLYPLLNRLKREGNLEYNWIESPTGPPRKYYFLTSQGKENLENLKIIWQKISNSIKQLITDK